MPPTWRRSGPPESVVPAPGPAGIASRGLARALDAAIQGVLMLVLVLVAGGLFGVSGTLAIVLVVVGLAVVILGYPIICEVATRGRPPGQAARPDERRVGKRCVGTCRSRWSPSP